MIQISALVTFKQSRRIQPHLTQFRQPKGFHQTTRVLRKAFRVFLKNYRDEKFTYQMKNEQVKKG